MHRLFLVVTTILTSVPSIAGEPTIVLMDDGTAWFSLGDGSPTIIVQNVVQPPGEKPGPGPTPQPPTSGIRADVTKWADDIRDPTGAAIMSKMYSIVGQNIGNGTIPSDTASVDKAITAAADKAIDMIPGRKTDDWEDLHRKVMDDLGRIVVTSGGKMSAAQWQKYFAEVSGGLDGSNQGAAIPPFLQPLIAALIQVLIELIQDLFAK